MLHYLGTYASITSGILLALIAAFRFTKLHSSFYPFIILVWIAALMDVLSLVLKNVPGFANGSYKLYVLIEPILVLYFFSRLGRIGSKYLNWYIISIVLIIAWVFDNLYLHSMAAVDSYYRVFYSLVLVFVTMEQINYQIVTLRGALYKDPVFLISTALMVNYVYRATIEAFYIFQLNLSNDFWTKLYLILQVVNTLCNITFGIAILWINKKKKFSLPY